MTPFNADGSVNVDEVPRARGVPRRQRLRRRSSSPGTTGESPTLSDDEKLELFAAARRRGRRPRDRRRRHGHVRHAPLVHLTERAHELGVDAILVVTPYYNKPPQRAIVRHFQEIAAADRQAGRRLQHPEPRRRSTSSRRRSSSSRRSRTSAPSSRRTTISSRRAASPASASTSTPATTTSSSRSSGSAASAASACTPTSGGRRRRRWCAATTTATSRARGR